MDNKTNKHEFACNAGKVTEYEVKEHIDTIMVGFRGFSKEVSIVKWNDKKPVFDMQYNDSLRSAVDKYYTGMENIQAMWSVMYNLKITTGEKAEQFENACYENIEDLKTMIAAKKAANFPIDIPPQIPAFVRLAMLYEKQQRYEEAINICVTAIKCGATHDGNKGTMYGRLARLVKKSGITPSKEAEALLIEKK